MPCTATSVPDAVGALMLEPVIVIDESTTSGLDQAGAGAVAHDWLTATGGAISYGTRPSAPRSPPPPCPDDRPDGGGAAAGAGRSGTTCPVGRP